MKCLKNWKMNDGYLLFQKDREYATLGTYINGDTNIVGYKVLGEKQIKGTNNFEQVYVWFYSGSEYFEID